MNLNNLPALMPTAVDPRGFDPLPSQLLIIIVCVWCVYLLRRFGKKVVPGSGKSFDAAINGLVLVSAASAVLAFTATRLGNNLTTALTGWVTSTKDRTVVVAATGTSLTVGAFLVVALAILGIVYIRTESIIALVLFAFGLFLASGPDTPVGHLLTWIIDPGFQSIWNACTGWLTSVLNSQPFIT